MPNPTLVRRVEILEETVDALTVLPDRMSSVETRLTSVEERLTSVEGRLTSVEGRLTSVEGRLTSVEGRLTTLNDEFVSFRAEVRAEFGAVREHIQDTRREMHVLHEDVISRIALLQEGIDRRNGRAARARKPPRRKQ
jgi:predicted  nucleic acid-binding Zn-ribbon protein